MGKKVLIDRYGRKINYFRISVTDRCNLKCIYCVPNSGIIHKKSDEILSYEEILRIVKVGASCGINKIRVTGGEPLVRKNIIYLINALSKIKGINEVSLTTNGLLLDTYAKDLKKAGLKRINISLDTLNSKKYNFITGKNALNKVLDGIYKAQKIGFNPVKINVVVMKGINDDEIVEFARLTLNEPYHIRFIELMPIGNNISAIKNKFIPNDEVKVYCQSLGELNEEKNHSTNNVSSSYRFKNAKGTISFISPISEPFCFKCSRLRLTSDGKLRLCLGSERKINLIPAIRGKNSSYDNLKRMFNIAVNLKPKGHHFSAILANSRDETDGLSDLTDLTPLDKTHWTMCQIGG